VISPIIGHHHLFRRADHVREDPILTFARDFSNHDDAIVATVRGYLADPPTDEEIIGFYGSKTYAPRTRVFLATVSLLGRKRRLDSVEDKYTVELLQQWRDDGVIDVTALPPAAKLAFGPMLDPSRSAPTSMEAYCKDLWTHYAKATEELEQQIAARGKVLLSIDATDGDTMFFALVDPNIAVRWRGKGLSEEKGYYAGVRPPMWDRFWDHLTYFSELTEPDQSGYPPGTRSREPILPLAEWAGY
jgi:hypothetical protein